MQLLPAFKLSHEPCTGAMPRNLPQVIFAARTVLASLSSSEAVNVFSGSALLSVRDLCPGRRQRPPFVVNNGCANDARFSKIDVQRRAVDLSISRLQTSSLAFKQECACCMKPLPFKTCSGKNVS